MCGVSMKDKRTGEELRRLVGVEPITTVIRSGRLRWYGHGTRKSDADLVKKCMEFRVDGKMSVGRPIRTWLERVKEDTEELEIDKEDVHDTKHIHTLQNSRHRYTTLHTAQHITNIPHSVLTGDVNGHSTLWHTYTPLSGTRTLMTTEDN